MHIELDSFKNDKCLQPTFHNAAIKDAIYNSKPALKERLILEF